MFFLGYTPAYSLLSRLAADSHHEYILPPQWFDFSKWLPRSISTGAKSRIDQIEQSSRSSHSQAPCHAVSDTKVSIRPSPLSLFSIKPHKTSSHPSQALYVTPWQEIGDPRPGDQGPTRNEDTLLDQAPKASSLLHASASASTCCTAFFIIWFHKSQYPTR